MSDPQGATMFGLPTTPLRINRHTFFETLVESEREALRELMIGHGVDDSKVLLIELRKNDVAYTVYMHNSDDRRYVDEKTGGAAVRTERHKIK